MQIQPYETELIVEHYLRGKRIDTFLEKHFRNYTSWRLQRLVQAGCVKIEGETALVSQRVRAGQNVSVRLLEPPDLVYPAEEIPIDVVYEDRWLLVVNKPPGLIVHPTGEISGGSLANAVQHHFNQQSRWRGLLRPGIVHRLDQDTSGLIVVAKDHLSHRELSVQFQKDRVSKTYLAIVEGELLPLAGTIDLPIGRHPGCASALMSAQGDAREALPARTLYSVIENLTTHSLVKVTPRSGRMHQIRVHLATIGHPVMGDPYYAACGVLKPPKHLQTIDPKALIPRQALHAAELKFLHPVTMQWCEFQQQLPTDMQSVLDKLRNN